MMGSTFQAVMVILASGVISALVVVFWPRKKTVVEPPIVVPSPDYELHRCRKCDSLEGSIAYLGERYNTMNHRMDELEREMVLAERSWTS